MDLHSWSRVTFLDGPGGLQSQLAIFDRFWFREGFFEAGPELLACFGVWGHFPHDQIGAG